MTNWTHLFLMFLCLSGCQATDYLTRDDCDADKDGDYAVGACGGHDCNDQNSLQSSLLAEVCNDNIDNNCDGQVDEDCQCAHDGEKRPCYIDENNKPFSKKFLDEKESNSTCHAGTQECINGIWRACHGAVGPKAELCDEKDNDCDGIIDEDLHIGEPCISGIGSCQKTGTIHCSPNHLPECGSTNPAFNDFLTMKRNDSWDNNCDGKLEPTCCDGSICNSDKCLPISKCGGEPIRYVLVEPLLQPCGSLIDVYSCPCDCTSPNNPKHYCICSQKTVGQIQIGCR